MRSARSLRIYIYLSVGATGAQQTLLVPPWLDIQLVSVLYVFVGPSLMELLQDPVSIRSCCNYLHGVHHLISERRHTKAGIATGMLSYPALFT